MPTGDPPDQTLPIRYWDNKTPYKCPVCNGTGLVSIPPGIAGDRETFSYPSAGPWSCKPCKGEGVIWN